MKLSIVSVSASASISAAVIMLVLLVFGNNNDCSVLIIAEASTSTATTRTNTAAATVASSSSSSTEQSNVINNKSSNKEKRLTLETMNRNLLKMEYAVRGTVVIKADKIDEELKTPMGKEKYGSKFDKILKTNIGNPQSVGQRPLTWPRQVLALVDLPNEVGVDHPFASQMFPEDAIRRAKEIKALGMNSSGSYSHSKGVKMFREDVVSFLQNRDGIEVPCDPEHIFLSNGASAAISNLLTAMIADSKCGVMIPIPQYPIYSATLDLLGGRKVGYNLDENKEWNLNVKELERSLKHAREVDGTNVVGFVLINPGNPTGSVLSKETVRDVVKFCSKHNLVLLADEVYQENVYDDESEFYSCKRAAYDTGLLRTNDIEIASFHSTSKGVFGECGRRGGYMELVGFDPNVIDQLYKLASASLCSSLNGQVMTSLMCRGPNPDDVSYKMHEKEKFDIFNSLKRRAKIVEKGLTSIPGISCETPKGSMYCFPSITNMPLKAIEDANKKGISPDTLYALSLLEQTGIVVVPASGFGSSNNKNRYGFRTTFLPSEEDMERSVTAMKEHHEEFVKKYN